MGCALMLRHKQKGQGKQVGNEVKKEDRNVWKQYSDKFEN